ncbi:MAG TPA: hypothetical protein PLT83_04325 [Thermoleophilia bacterium]|nr:hypothetical protein [Thermoleophilia bacterium]
MRRKHLSVWAGILLVVALTVVLAAGCGGDEGTTAASPSPTEQLTPQEIVDQCTAAMNEVTSASFTADFKIDVQGDASKVTDETARQLLAKPITLHAEGASSTDPQAADVDLALSFSGQNLAMTILNEGEKAWVQYQGTWYAVPPEQTKALQAGESGGAPEQQLRELGLDPKAWNVEWELAGIETVDDIQVYHLTASPDPKKIAGDLMKTLNDPDFYKKLGDQATAAQVKALQKENAALLKQVQKALDSLDVELWIETGSKYLRKSTLLVGMDTKAIKGAKGLTAMTLGFSLGMADFGQPVEVTPPAKAKSFDKLMNDLTGGMTPGASL